MFSDAQGSRVSQSRRGIRQAEGCSTETDKNHWLTTAEEWLRMAQQEVLIVRFPSNEV